MTKVTMLLVLYQESFDHITSHRFPYLSSMNNPRFKFSQVTTSSRLSLPLSPLRLGWPSWNETSVLGHLIGEWINCFFQGNQDRFPPLGWKDPSFYYISETAGFRPGRGTNIETDNILLKRDLKLGTSKQIVGLGACFSEAGGSGWMEYLQRDQVAGRR